MQAPRLSEGHRKLLQLVYEHFRETATWPRSRGIRLAIRQHGELLDLCQQLGPDVIVCGGLDPDRGCELRIHALPFLQGAERDIAIIGAALPFLVQRYIAADDSTVSAAQVEEALGASELEVRRLVLWLYYAPMVTRTHQHGQDGTIVGFTLSHDILALEGVNTLEEYLARCAEFERRRADRAVVEGAHFAALRTRKRPGRLPFQSSEPVADPRTGLDLLDLHPALREQVEALFADQHYREAVRTGLTFFEVRVREIVSARVRDARSFPTGAPLMGKAFGSDDPLIPLNTGLTPSEQNEQRGFHLLAQGTMTWQRNLLSHELPELSPAQALEWLALISMLMKRLDSAQRRSTA